MYETNNIDIGAFMKTLKEMFLLFEDSNLPSHLEVVYETALTNDFDANLNN